MKWIIQKMSKVMIIPLGSSGNLLSVERAIKELGYDVCYFDRDIDLNEIHSVILPGVGSFADSMNFIKDDIVIIEKIVKAKPTLGICLGMQILASIGFEGGYSEGMKFISGEVIEMRVRGSIPHIGWTTIDTIKDSIILKNINIRDRFYFMHSYELINYTDYVGLSSYNCHQFVSVVEKGKLFGVQFHPEKSGINGLRVLSNFLEFGDKNE